VPLAAAKRDELKPTAAVIGFLKQAFKFPVSFGGQRSIQSETKIPPCIDRALSNFKAARTSIPISIVVRTIPSILIL
jgi:hypothetical protein